MQHQGAIEFPERDQAEPEVADDGPVQVGVAVTLDQRQRVFIQLHGFARIALAGRGEAQIAAESRLEELVVTRQRHGQCFLVDLRAGFVVAQQLRSDRGAVQRGDLVGLQVVRGEIGARLLQAAHRAVQPFTLFGARHFGSEGVRLGELGHRAQHGRAMHASGVADRIEMRLGGLGGAARIFVVVQQEILQPAELVFGFGQRAHVLGGLEMHDGRAHRRHGLGPRCLVALAHQGIAVAEFDVAQQALVRRRIGLLARPAKDAHRGGAAPGALVDAVQCQFHRRRPVQANYQAMHAMSKIGVAEFRVLAGGVHLHAQVDVAFPDLEKIDALTQLAREGLGAGTLDVDFGGILDQRLGFQAVHASGKEYEPDRAEKPGTSGHRILVVCSRVVAAGFAHFRRVPFRSVPMFTGTCASGQFEIEKGGRVCSKSLIENTLSYDSSR